MELIANTTAPRVYTPARIAQIAAANAAGGRCGRWACV